MGLNPGFNTGSLFHLFCLTAVIRNLIPRFDNRLVTAPAQRQIDSILSPCIGLSIGNRIHANADTHGHGHFISNVNLPDFIQNGKTAGLNRRHMFMIHNKGVSVLFHLCDDGIIRLHVLGYLSLD